MRKILLYLTGFCIALFCYMAYLEETVEAWTVIPWMIVVFMNQYKDYKDNEE